VAGSGNEVVQFTALPINPATGLVLAENRQYDPGLGRWLSEDPMGMKDGPNLFSYVANDPIRYIDPTGLFLFHPVLPNGNITGTFNPQRKGCDVIGFGGGSGRTCMAKCCQEHDDCFTRGRCNWTSFLTIAYDSACTRCNRAVVVCYSQSWPLPPEACRTCKQ
jgi:RHS repeat-associated protein